METESLFMMMLTTGMRIGGYANLKTSYIADIMNGSRIRQDNFEKGPKIFHFKLHQKVQELLTIWLNKKRGFDSSEYVFPWNYRGQKNNTIFQDEISENV